MDLPPGVRLEPGFGGLTKVVVATDLATAEVYLHGAHVTHYQPAGQGPVLFLSRQSLFAAGKAIRGGVPICFPWFGPLENRPKAPAHGFARTSLWALAAATRDGGGVVTLRFELSRGEDPASDWPHAFRAEYAVTVGPELTMALTIHHVGGEPFLYEAALHTYLSVGDVRQASVTGLENTPYLDKAAGREEPGVDAPVRFTGETDRVYQETTAACTADDPAGHRTIRVEKSGSASTVVWNPWVAKAKAMSDFGDGEWPGMLCIETANVRGSAVTLGPGGSHTMTAVVRVGSR